MFVFNAIVAFVIAFVSFCNGVVSQQTSQKARDEEISFHEAWEEIVEEAQGTGMAARMMKCYYFIPSMLAAVDRRHEIYV